MLYSAFVTPALFGIGAFLSAYAAISVITKRRSDSENLDTQLNEDLTNSTLVYLLRDGEITDCNFAGERFLEKFPYAGVGLSRLRAALTSRFDGIDGLFVPGPRPDTQRLSRDGELVITSVALGSSVRLRISPLDASSDERDDVHRLAATEAELETLRESTDRTPFLVWREAPDGTPVWVNRAYADRVAAVFSRERLLSWPLPRLFPDLKRGEARRLSLTSEGETALTWFECHGTPLGPDTLYTAFDATGTVEAETKLREFTQTLTKTFAELATGLAIFDRSRHLVLFNPALLELTGLPVEFMTSKPSLVSMIDKLREHQMVPEPRDYKSWRQSISELESAAENGTYTETWGLPGNRTYRVSGRPHPDGAIAFLFEDISAEMTLTRGFRAQLETCQTVLDNLNDAVAVFDSSGTISMTNRSYRELWGSAPDTQLLPMDVMEATRSWYDKSLPTPVWGDFRDFVEQTESRSEWAADVYLRDGRSLRCRFLPLTDGSTQAVFEISNEDKPITGELRQVV